MLIQKPIDQAFNGSFDIGFTYCNNKIAPMPINGGIILVHARGKEKAILFLERVQECWATKLLDKMVWWGDQLSIIKTIGYQNFYTRSYDFIISFGVRIVLLSGALYNFTDETTNKMDKKYPYPCLFHFRGNRKFSMPIYWINYLEQLL
jgi:hypothetical protein